MHNHSAALQLSGPSIHSYGDIALPRTQSHPNQAAYLTSILARLLSATSLMWHGECMVTVCQTCESWQAPYRVSSRSTIPRGDVPQNLRYFICICALTCAFASLWFIFTASADLVGRLLFVCTCHTLTTLTRSVLSRFHFLELDAVGWIKI
ncbi:hypothetical protein EV401DRAFT_446906 [Pisolithus croceorrhizus]|nr:hypothetical protein EV401DRAFT_446906 [Pisolithus croceorrhizus]